MAARWSASALLLQLLLAAGLAVALAASALSAIAIAGLVLAELGGFAFLLAGAPLVLARRKAPSSVGRGRMMSRFRALCGDALALEIALGRMALEPYRPPPDAAAGVASLRTPVMLVHGFACSRALWRPLLARLRAAGIGPVRALSLEPLLADIETCAGELLRQLEGQVAGGSGGCVTIVTHSMGGLVARAALRRARPGLIGRIVTIGAPHHGTALACRFPWPSTRQMCPGSSWLRDLNACQEGLFGIPVTTLYSLDDNYVVPAGSARLQGARAIELQGIGHLALLRSQVVLERIVAELLA